MTAIQKPNTPSQTEKPKAVNENEHDVTYANHETAMFHARKAMEKYRDALARLAK